MATLAVNFSQVPLRNSLKSSIYFTANLHTHIVFVGGHQMVATGLKFMAIHLN